MNPLQLFLYKTASFEKWNLFCWLVVLRIYVALAVFQPYHDLEISEIQVARRGIEPRTSCSASQELNHSATAALLTIFVQKPHFWPKIQNNYNYVFW